MSVASESARRNEALAFLLARVDYERAATIPYHQREFRLDRMRQLLARLDDPHEKLKIIHVAGTKGKGSTSAMIAAALSACGYRTGLYTSPHLERLEERVMVDGQACDSTALAALVERIRPVVEQMDREAARPGAPLGGPTYFEITTAMALLHFAAVQTDFAVVEVGLGGRLDSTNVCRPLVSVITSISFDHMRQLGNTLAAIAAEKAGIIKPAVPVVSGVVDGEPRQVIEQIARGQNAPLRQLKIDFDYAYAPPRAVDLAADGAAGQALGRLDFFNRSASRQRSLCGAALGLLGRHQAANAAVALAALDELAALGFALPEAGVRQGLARLRWPARVEIVARRPTVLVDAAHNAASIQSLVETLDESFSAQRRLLVFGTTYEKDVAQMLRILLPHFDAVVFTRYLNNPRAVDVQELEALAAECSSVGRFLCADPAAAWDQVRTWADARSLVCITGSFFLASEMRSEIARRPIVCSSPPVPQSVEVQCA